jgi:hypothetical protein
VQKLGLEWACTRFCIGTKIKECNVLIWVWRSSAWMKEKERWQKLVFCFVKVERILKEKTMIAKSDRHFGEWEQSGKEKGVFLFLFLFLFFILLKFLLSY